MISTMNDDLRNSFFNAEKFGYSTNKVESGIALAKSGSGENSKTEGDLEMTLAWLENKGVYTLLGSFNWKKDPVYRGKDIIGIDFGEGAVVNNSQYIIMQYEKKGETKTESYEYGSEQEKCKGYACIFEVNLPNIGNSIRFLISYEVIPSPGHRYTLFGNYYHRFMPFPVSVSISYIVGISVSPSDIFTEYNIQCGVL